MKESKVQNDILQYLRSIDARAVKVLSANFNGVSDILACVDGRFVALEVKVLGKKHTLKPLQQRYIQDVINAGGIAGCVVSVDEVKELLNESKMY